LTSATARERGERARGRWCYRSWRRKEAACGSHLAEWADTWRWRWL